ncbi:MAG TPA: acyl-CoA dehydrogenase family protein [Streptosporangiaceae bacterium]|jgi:alkylation response protein AidB-like acyl-CoA dehydrogenase
MNLLYTDVETDLRASVRALLDERAPASAVLAHIEDADNTDLKLWRTLATDLGCAGLPVPEERGGAGATWRETAVVAEELGRAVTPVPFLGSAVLGTAALLAAGDAETLEAAASGEKIVTLAVPLTAMPDSYAPTVQAEDGTLTGTVTSVADAGHADALLVPAADGLYLVDASDVTRTPVVSLDMTRRLTDITLDGASGRRIADGTDAVARALAVGGAMLAAEQLGLAEHCLNTTIAYVKERHQFGRAIGSYQALKHRLADLYGAVSQARAVARYAASCVADDDPDAPVAVALAQAYTSEVVVTAAEECVQMHGGIGFTWEHPAHLYLKRAKADSIALGTADRHRAALAALVDLAPA